MDSFEALVRLLLERDGYWTRQSEKIELTKEEKRQIGKPSIPRSEIDVIAYKPNKNTIIAMEVKSYLDSLGVQAKDLRVVDQDIPEGRYKLFTCKNYREIVLGRLLEQYREKGLANANTKVQLGLSAGKIYSNDEQELKPIFARNNWLLWPPSALASKATDLASLGYENDPFVLLAKLLVRNPNEL